MRRVVCRRGEGDKKDLELVQDRRACQSEVKIPLKIAKSCFFF